VPVGFWISVDIEDMFEWKDEHSVQAGGLDAQHRTPFQIGESCAAR